MESINFDLDGSLRSRMAAKQRSFRTTGSGFTQVGVRQSATASYWSVSLTQPCVDSTIRS